MFGLLKKVLPGAKERRLSPTEARLADAWIEKAQSNQLNWEQELDAMSDKETLYLYFAFTYSIEKLGRFMMTNERFGFLGMVSRDVEQALAATQASELQQIRANVKKVFLASVPQDGSMDPESEISFALFRPNPLTTSVQPPPIVVTHRQQLSTAKLSSQPRQLASRGDKELLLKLTGRGSA